MYQEPSIISFSVKQLGAIIAASACSEGFSCSDTFDSNVCDDSAQQDGGSFGGGAHN